MDWKKTAAVLLAAFLGCSCSQPQENLQSGSEENKHEATTFAMDTVMMFTVYHEDGEEILIDAEQEIRRLEHLFSVTMEGSEIFELNRKAGEKAVAVSGDTMELLSLGKAIGEETGGCFNIAISPIVKAWGFTEEEKHVPPQEEIDRLLPLADTEDILLDAENGTAFLQKKGMAVDLGGIAKGYAADKAAELLRAEGVASGFFSLGGNLVGIGRKPDGTAWKAAVANPLDAEDYVGMVEFSDCAVVTSGGYQRYFEENGKRYHHIIDPATGFPAENGLLAVVIVCENAARADAFSTALFVMGLDDAAAFWRERNDFEAIFITNDEVIATEGLADTFAFEGRDNTFGFRILER